MTCKGILNTLSDYLEGDTAEVVCMEIEDHLDGCEKCRMHIDTMRAIVTLFKGWRGDDIPEDVSGRLREAVAGTVERACKRSAKSSARGKSAAKPLGDTGVKVKKTGSIPTRRRKATGKPAVKSRKKSVRKPKK
jgi:RNA polymerase sigma-70 factor (ECF subfamily)